MSPGRSVEEPGSVFLPENGMVAGYAGRGIAGLGKMLPGII